MSTEDPRSIDRKISSRLRKLIEANHSLADMESLEQLMPRLLNFARSVTDAEASSLLLYNPKRNVLEFASVKDQVLGEKADEILKGSIELKMGEGIAGWVAQNRSPLIVRDVQSDPRFFKQADKETGFVTRTILCVPLIHREELLGVINVLNSRGKPCFDTEDEEILESFADLAAVAIIRSRLIETRLKQQRLQTQLEAASKIQSLFWPRLPEMESGSRVWAVSVPAAFVGGDLYDVIPMPDSSWLIYVADVADKGLPAALIMAALSTKIRSEALLHGEVDKLLEIVNTAMYELMAEEGFFATIVLGKYWPATGRMQLALGGHLSPLWVVGSSFADVPHTKGMALGITPGATYEKTELSLSPGESILFITDGITEAGNVRNELFGYRRLVNYIKSTSGPPWGNGLLDAVKAWRGGAEPNDDLTIVETWREPA
jgi:serine phosphatase RsbU (regulator of sigma subunit)